MSHGPVKSEKKSVLVIEDDPDARDLLVRVLESAGYRVRATSNCVTGLAHLRSEPTCLVLLDLMVPVMDGWQFRAAQLNDPDVATVPVLVVSGHPTVGQQAKLLGAAGYLPKPIDVDRLVEMVKQHC